MRFKIFTALFLLACTQTFAAYETGPANSVLRVPNTIGRPKFGSIDLSKTATVGTSVLPILNGGTNGATPTAGFNNLSPMTTLGDTIYGGASGSRLRLGGNTTTTPKALVQTGDGVNSAAPSWGNYVSSVNGLSGALIFPVAGGHAEITDAVVPYDYFGQHVQTLTQSLTAVNMGLHNSGSSSATVTVRLNQYRSGTLFNSATASITVAAGLYGASVGSALSGTLSLLSGDLITFDCISVTGTPEWLTVEY